MRAFVPLIFLLSSPFLSASAACVNQIPLFPAVSDAQPEQTIYQYISGEERYSRLKKAIDSSDKIVDLLNGTTRLTFFAVPDWALPPKGGGKNGDYNDLFWAFDSPNFFCSSYTNGEDHKKNKLRHKFIEAVLSYHILPESKDAFQLTENITHPTKLVVRGAYANQPLRLRVEHTIIPPVTSINFYSKVIKANTDVSNGIIHELDHVLFPPPSIFQEVFSMPDKFSTFTSALQRTGLTESLDLRPKKDGDRIRFKGTDAATLFIPSNQAFDNLPKKLKLYLFSPLGLDALQSVIEYHVAPQVILDTDYFYNATKTGDSRSRTLSEGQHFRLPTLLESHDLNIEVVKQNISIPLPGPRQPSIVSRKMIVNGQTVAVSDAVALNGASHVIDKVLDPRCARNHESNAEPCVEWHHWEEFIMN